MVPFKEVLSEVRKVLQEENLLPSLLAQLVEAQIFSAQYYQTFISENLCDVDVDELARRLALPVWEKWDASKVILSSVLMESEPENHGMIFV
ncbi:MHC class II transactivator isoform X1 [Tachysurus ichikawai]